MSVPELGKPRHVRVGLVALGCSNLDKVVWLPRAEFDVLWKANQFGCGPQKDTFGQGYGEPYYPYNQAYGRLKDGRYVICELNPDLDKEHPDGK